MEGYVVGIEPYDQPKVIQNHQDYGTRPFGFDLIKAPLRESGLFACISSRITAVYPSKRFYPVH